MKKYTKIFGTVIAALLFSGFAFGHGVQNDLNGDVLSGHSSDHQDSVLANSSKTQPPQMGHANEQNSEDTMHQITVHDVKLNASASTPPTEHSKSAHDNSEDMVHIITVH